MRYLAGTPYESVADQLFAVGAFVETAQGWGLGVGGSGLGVGGWGLGVGGWCESGDSVHVNRTADEFE